MIIFDVTPEGDNNKGPKTLVPPTHLVQLYSMEDKTSLGVEAEALWLWTSQGFARLTHTWDLAVWNYVCVWVWGGGAILIKYPNSQPVCKVASSPQSGSSGD